MAAPVLAVLPWDLWEGLGARRGCADLAESERRRARLVVVYAPAALAWLPGHRLEWEIYPAPDSRDSQPRRAGRPPNSSQLPMSAGRPGRNEPNLGSSGDLRRLARGTTFGPVREPGRSGFAAGDFGPTSEQGRPGSPGRIFEPTGEAGRTEPPGRLFDRTAGEPRRAGPVERFFDPTGDPRRPGGVGEPGRFDRPGGIGDPAKSPGFDGLESLARSGATERSSSTAPVDWQSLSNQADQVRDNYNYDDCFSSRDWWDRYAAAWVATEWANAAAAAYSTASWDDCSSYGGYDSEPIYYDYGTNFVYEGNTVYVNGDAVATEEEYAEKAMTIANTGASYGHRGGRMACAGRVRHDPGRAGEWQ